MRDFFINALDKLVAVIVVLMIIAVLISGFGAMATPPQSGMPSGVVLGLLILIGGGLYVILLGGFMYLGLGIYHNTKRTADALEGRGV